MGFNSAFKGLKVNIPNSTMLPRVVCEGSARKDSILERACIIGENFLRGPLCLEIINSEESDF